MITLNVTKRSIIECFGLNHACPSAPLLVLSACVHIFCSIIVLHNLAIVEEASEAN